MHESITLSMCLHCTFYNPGPTAHMLYWATAQIPVLHFPVLIFKLILGYSISFLSCSNFYVDGKETLLHLCLPLTQTRISANTMYLATGVYKTRGGNVAVA